MTRFQWTEVLVADTCQECGTNIPKGDVILEDQEEGRAWCKKCGKRIEGDGWGDADFFE